METRIFFLLACSIISTKLALADDSQCTQDGLCGVCSYGEGVQRPCDPLKGYHRVCVPCPQGYFVVGQSCSRCLKCREECNVGEVMTRKCTRYHDINCKVLGSNIRGKTDKPLLPAMKTTVAYDRVHTFKWITPNRPIFQETVPNKPHPGNNPGNNHIQPSAPTPGSPSGIDLLGKHSVVAYIVIAVVATLAVVIFSLVIFWCCRRHKKSKKKKEGEARHEGTQEAAQESLMSENIPPDYEKYDVPVDRPPSYSEAITCRFSSVRETGEGSCTIGTQQTHHMYPDLSQQTHRQEKAPVSDDVFNCACSQQTGHSRAPPTAPPSDTAC